MDWDDDNPPMPRKGDLLVRNDDDVTAPRTTACLNPTWGSPEHGYTQGYWRGARILVQHVIDTQLNQDYLAYPIIFLYRHHVELALKDLIRRAPGLIGRPNSQLETHHLGNHRLDWLWQDLKQIFDAIAEPDWGKPDDADIEGIDDYIRQLCELDPDSYRLRYPRSKRDAPSLLPNLNINLLHFAQLMNRLADCFETLDMATYALEETKAERLARIRLRDD
jgi:hypothetical protein